MNTTEVDAQTRTSVGAPEALPVTAGAQHRVPIRLVSHPEFSVFVCMMQNDHHGEKYSHDATTSVPYAIDIQEE